MDPTRHGAVLTAVAAENAAATDATVDAATAADVDPAGGSVEPTAADDDARGAVNPTAADDADNVDGICRSACHDHCHHGLRNHLEPRCRAPGRCLVA